MSCSPLSEIHHSHPGTILPCKILFSPRNYTSPQKRKKWKICNSLYWPRNYTSQKKKFQIRELHYPVANCEYKFKLPQTKVINSAKIETTNYVKECFLICSFKSFSNEFLTSIFPQYLSYKSLFFTKDSFLGFT